MSGQPPGHRDRPLLVGEQNLHSADPGFALWPEPRGASGDRLRRVFGLTDDEYLAEFERVNLLGRGEWDAAAAAQVAQALHHHYPARVPFVLLGRKVATAFGFKRTAPPACLTRSARRWAVLPHPSGLSRVWNDPTMAPESRRAVARAAQEEFPDVAALLLRSTS